MSKKSIWERMENAGKKGWEEAIKVLKDKKSLIDAADSVRRSVEESKPKK